MKVNIYLKSGAKVVLPSIVKVNIKGDGGPLTSFGWETENLPRSAEKALYTNLDEVAMITTEDR